MKKKWTALLLTGAMALSLTACGGQTTTTSSGSSGETGSGDAT